MNSALIGIDLGTTNSLVAHWRDDQAVLIPNSLGSYLTPSAVHVDDGGTVLIGQAAWEKRITSPARTAVAFKRTIGTEKRHRLGSREFAAEELSSFVLSSLRADAEANLGCAVNEAVISVPAYFNDAQRKSTKAAAALAGLHVTRLISEPTAAALAYGLHRAQSESRFLVFDLGGGTFDVSIVELFEGVIEVKASTGDSFLGGEDFTAAVAERMRAAGGWPADAPREALALLDAGAERIKRSLSMGMRGEVDLARSDGSREAFALTDEAFEALCAPLLERIRAPIVRALRDARLEPASLDELIMVGGASRMPVVRRLVTRMFGRFPNVELHPDHAIALGAATQAALVARHEALDEVLMTDVCPYSLGTEVSRKLDKGGSVDGLFSPIIERNTVVPVSRQSSYVSGREGQRYMDIGVFQGENRFVADNIKIGTMRVPLPGGKIEDSAVDVRFSYDSSGLLEVDATVRATGQREQLTLMGNSGVLSADEIAERRLRLAALKIHPRDDMPNQALLARMERLYAESLGERRQAIGDAIVQLTQALDTQDLALIARARHRWEGWLEQVDRSPFDVE